MAIHLILFYELVIIKAFVDNELINTVNSGNLTVGGNMTISNPPEPLMTVIGRFGWGMIGLALTIWALAWVFVSCLNFAAARQVLHDKILRYQTGI